MTNSSKNNLKNEQRKIRQLHIIMTLLFFLSEFLNHIFHKDNLDLISILKVIFLILIFRLFAITIKRQIYSFWTVGFIVSFYCLFMCFLNIFFRSQNLVGFLFILTFFVLLIEFYLFSSPIFFPRVRWWEYDFRYRYDLPIEVNWKSDKYKGRLTDLRRGSGCIVLFKEIPIGQKIEVKIQDDEKTSFLQCYFLVHLISKREFTPGRGLSYGVKFILDNSKAKNNFKYLAKLWKSHSKKKLRSKIKN